MQLDLAPKNHPTPPEWATGLHMIPGLDALIAFNRSKRSRSARDLADILDCMRACILAESGRADRAEGIVKQYEKHTNWRPICSHPLDGRAEG